MLAFTRRPGEAFYIDNGVDVITVTVVDVRGAVVKLSIDAPLTYHIVRDNAKDKAPRDRGTA